MRFKRELIYTHAINNNIQSIIRSVESKTPIVSPMVCVDSPRASRSFDSRGEEFFFLLSCSFLGYLVHSWCLCGRCCTHSFLPRTGRVPRTEDRYTGRRGRHIRCPSSRCSTDSVLWCTGRCRCTALGRRLWGDISSISGTWSIYFCFVDKKIKGWLC